MKTYAIYDKQYGYLIGEVELSAEEVRALNDDDTIIVVGR